MFLAKKSAENQNSLKDNKKAFLLKIKKMKYLKKTSKRKFSAKYKMFLVFFEVLAIFYGCGSSLNPSAVHFKIPPSKWYKLVYPAFKSRLMLLSLLLPERQ